MREIATRRVTPLLSPSTRATSQRGWDCRRRSSNLPTFAGSCMTSGRSDSLPGLLEKPGALTLEERRQMETHSAIGGILARVADYGEIASIVRHHHERVDGEGYPDRIDGNEIPLISRIISVADAYNAMTSDRPYRDAMPSRVARLRLAQAVGSQFDTTVVAAFEAILATAGVQIVFALTSTMKAHGRTTFKSSCRQWRKPFSERHRARVSQRVAETGRTLIGTRNSGGEFGA